MHESLYVLLQADFPDLPGICMSFYYLVASHVLRLSVHISRSARLTANVCLN